MLPNHQPPTKAVVIRKSTKLGMMLLADITSREKCTFKIRFELLTTLFQLSKIAFEKNCHGNMAAATNSAYGTPPARNLPTFPTTVSARTASAGWISAQANPATVCL